jgi:hypothetical protein
MFMVPGLISAYVRAYSKQHTYVPIWQHLKVPTPTPDTSIKPLALASGQGPGATAVTSRALHATM